jgi:hypothetical protein
MSAKNKPVNSKSIANITLLKIKPGTWLLGRYNANKSSLDPTETIFRLKSFPMSNSRQGLVSKVPQLKQTK